MTDVRLTALNPVDSQVYPVACNTSGELLVADDGIDYLPLTGGELTGPLTSTSSITLEGSITTASGNVFIGGTSAGTAKTALNANGSATFGAGIDLTDSTVDLYSQTTNSNSKSFKLFSDIGGTKAEKAFITAAGAATFGSTTTVGGSALSGAAAGVSLYPTGGIHATQASGTSTILSGYIQGSSTKNVAITAAGAATFAGDVTAPNITSLNTLVKELQTKMSLIMRQIDISAETP
jgi:hypothetical protein